MLNEKQIFTKVLASIKSTKIEQGGIEHLTELLNHICEQKFDLTRAITKKGHTFLIEAVIKNKREVAILLLNHV